MFRTPLFSENRPAIATTSRGIKKQRHILAT
jgi:hypothetical protein